MYRVILVDSFKKYENCINKKFEYKFCTTSELWNLNTENPIHALFLSEAYISDLHRLRQIPHYQNALIVIFANPNQLVTCADLVITEPLEPKSFMQANEKIEMLLSPLHKEVIINFLKHLIVVKDPDLRTQMYRVPYLVKFIVEKMHDENLYSHELTKEFIKDTIYFSTFHDLGKLAIVNENLNYTGIFDDHQRRTMQLHTTLGYELFASIAELLDDFDSTIARNIIYYHHEKFDGTGYPKKLCGTNIPLEARIVAIADVYDALRSKRKYKLPFSHQESFQILLSQKDKHFDAKIIEVLEKYDKEFQEHYEQFV